MRQWMRNVGSNLLNPYLTGVYVLAAFSSAITFSVCAFGYGATWPADVLLILIGSLLATAIVLSTRIQWFLWRKLYPSSNPSLQLPLGQAVFYSLLLLVASFVAGRLAGDGLRTVLTRRTCRDCQPFLDELVAYKRNHGTFPSDARTLGSYHSLAKHRRIYLVQESNADKELRWNLDDLDRAEVSLFVLPDRFQCVVPIERSSLISFSHFRVYLFESTDNQWRRTLMHWSLLGAYMD